MYQRLMAGKPPLDPFEFESDPEVAGALDTLADLEDDSAWDEVFSIDHDHLSEKPNG